MTICTPEQAGIPSSAIHKFLASLEENHLATHDILIARGDRILFEHYVPPFHKDYLHRMYSVTKSFVSIAIGFCLQDGLLDLDDPIVKYFPKETAHITDQYVLNQTIRHMLMMSTARSQLNWFTARCDDRVQYYFDSPCPTRPAGSKFEYDSSGSFILGALVERLTGRSLLAYLREKLFDKIGVSQGAHFLHCPGGHSWGDSALLATPRDLLLTARFCLNGGSWNGEQLLDADYMREATSWKISTGDPDTRHPEKQGYGYQFWITYGKGFYFNGMGCQFAVCVPEKDLIFVTNGDNQGRTDGANLLIKGFYDAVVSETQDTPLPQSDDHAKLLAYASSLKLATAVGELTSPMAEKINGVEYTLEENPMGITRFKLNFDERGGRFDYTNAQGDKSLPFGIGDNLYGLFPQTGYSMEVGSVASPGHRYRCAASGAWKDANTLSLRVQLIDDYFGNFWAEFKFDGDSVRLNMVKAAEDFLDEYHGTAIGHR